MMSRPKAKAKRSEIWLVRFPFSDLTSAKRRPALVLAVYGEDVIVVGIFSRIPRGSLRKTWIRLAASHADFVQSGLKKSSILKAEKIAVIHQSVLQRRLGILSAGLMKRVNKALKIALHLTEVGTNERDTDCESRKERRR